MPNCSAAQGNTRSWSNCKPFDYSPEFYLGRLPSLYKKLVYLDAGKHGNAKFLKNHYLMRSILWFLLCFMPLMAMAQIQIPAGQLPQTGDTLLFSTDNLPANIQVGVPGENLRWDFSTLQAPYVRRTTWLPADQGQRPGLFPHADLLLPLGDRIESYYQFRNQGRSLYRLGALGSDLLDLGIEGAITYSEPELYLRTPLAFGDQFSHTYAFQQTIAADELPDFLLDELPISPDSFRVSLIAERHDAVDAWGRLLIPGGFYDALREKRTIVQRLKLEAKLGPFPWSDITGLLREEDFPSERTLVEYYFFSNESTHPVAIIEMGPEERFVRRAIFRSSPLTTNIREIDDLQPGVYAFPNPAIVTVRFEFTNLPPGNYQLSIRNILGIEVWREDYYLTGNRTERVDISNLRKGTYLYSLKNDQGKILATRRLVVVRP